MIVYIPSLHTYIILNLGNDHICSIPLAFKARIRFCLGKGARLWLIVKPFICSFHIVHFIFILTLHIYFSLTQPSTSV
jgi:hypothetical protein